MHCSTDDIILYSLKRSIRTDFGHFTNQCELKRDFRQFFLLSVVQRKCNNETPSKTKVCFEYETDPSIVFFSIFTAFANPPTVWFHSLWLLQNVISVSPSWIFLSRCFLSKCKDSHTGKPNSLKRVKLIQTSNPRLFCASGINEKVKWTSVLQYLSEYFL